MFAVLVPALFILAMALLIGWYVGRSVPDEPQLGGAYLRLGIDALFIILIGLLLYELGYVWAALLAIVLILLRKGFHSLYAPLSGMVIGIAVLLDAQMQITLFVLVLVLNFLIGVTTAKRDALWRNVWQPGAALMLSTFLFLIR